jgi:hypothetical protein
LSSLGKREFFSILLGKREFVSALLGVDEGGGHDWQEDLGDRTMRG